MPGEMKAVSLFTIHSFKNKTTVYHLFLKNSAIVGGKGWRGF